VANTTAPGEMVPAEENTDVTRPPPHFHGGGGDPGGELRQASREASHGAQRIETALASDERSRGGKGEPGHQRGDLAGVQPFDRGRGVDEEALRVRCQGDPVQLYQPDTTWASRLQALPERQAGAA
jgi:hypothetical protein